MTPYERLMSALNGEPVDRVPVAPIVREWSARQAGFTFSEIMSSASKYVYAQYYCAKHFQLDALWDLWGIHAEAEAMGSVLKIPDDMACSVATPAIQDYEKDFSKLRLPNPYKDAHLPLILEGVRQLKDISAGLYPVLSYIQGPFRLASMLRGSESIMKDCMKKNAHLEELLELCTNALIIYGTALVQAGADVIWIGDPTSSGDAVSKKLWLTYGFPYTKKLVNAIKRNKVKILMHICGNTSDRLYSFAETGIDAMSLDEKVDLSYAREIMGQDICLWGNVSPARTMFFGKPDEVEEEARRCIEKGITGKSKFVLCSGCMVPAEVPPQNMEALVRAAQRFEIV